MNRRPITAAVGVATVLALAGCGQATQTAADEPAPAAASSTSSDPAGSDAADGTVEGTLPPPQWPATGCDTRAVTSVDYGRMPTGFDTPEEAVLQGNVGDIPDGTAVLAPAEGKGPAQVWIVDPATNEIQAQVSVYRGPDGWFVDGVMHCG